MKKITLFFLFTLCVSCLKSTFYEDPQKDVSPLITKGGHTSTGLLIAKEDAEFILHLYFPDKDTLSCESVDTYAGTAMYIFNFINGGWAAIAGDKRMSPLLAYDKEGALDTSIQHDGLQTWIGLGIDEFIALQEHYPPSYSTSYSDYWNHFRDSIFIDCSYLKTPNTKSGDVMYYWVKEFWYSTTVSVTDYTIKDHLIPTKWGQGSPWNDSFPYMRDSLGVFRPCPAGCSAVAMAQILRYFNRFQCTPSWLYHNVSFSYNSDSTDVSITHSNLVNYSPAWDAMALNSSSSYPYSTKWYVRNLLLDVGGVLDMN